MKAKLPDFDIDPNFDIEAITGLKLEPIPRRGESEKNTAIPEPATPKRAPKPGDLGSMSDGLGSVSLSDLMVMDIPEPRWLLDGIIPEGPSCGFIAGQPKSCKSWLALQLAIAAATGGQVLEREILQGDRSVLVVAGEGGLARLRQRLVLLSSGYGLQTDPPDPRLEKIRVSVCPPLDLAANLLLPTIRAELDRMDSPGLLILDPLTRLHSGDEDKRTAMEPVLTSLTRLSADYGLSIVVVHHSKKNNSGGAELDALRGTSAFRGWFDFLLAVRSRKAATQSTRTIDIELRDGAPPTPITFRLNVSEIMGTASLDLAEPENKSASKPEQRRDRMRDFIASEGAVKKSEIEAEFSTEVSEKTIDRDLKDLVEAHQIEKDGSSYRLAGKLLNNEVDRW